VSSTSQGFVCSECGRRIGLMAGKDGKPELFKCRITGEVAELQVPVARKTPTKPMAFASEAETDSASKKKKKKPSAIAFEGDQLAQIYNAGRRV